MSQQTLQNQSYLTFKLGEEIFAASVEHVVEILELSKITKVPRSPDFMRGVINLRGSVLPVVDSRLKFGLPQADDTVNTCIMVLNILSGEEHLALGALVDSVQEVMEIDASKVQPAPAIGSKYKSDFIDGMLKSHEQFIMLLNLNKVFSQDEVILLQENQNETISEN